MDRTHETHSAVHEDAKREISKVSDHTRALCFVSFMCFLFASPHCFDNKCLRSTKHSLFMSLLINSAFKVAWIESGGHNQSRGWCDKCSLCILCMYFYLNHCNYIEYPVYMFVHVNIIS